MLYGVPPANPLMPSVARAMGPDLKRAKVTVRPDSERVILSVPAQPGALGLVDLTKIGRHETKVKLLPIIPPGETEAARASFGFLNEGGGRDALLAGGLVPRPQPEATEAEVAAWYGPVEESQAAGPQGASPAGVAFVRHVLECGNLFPL